MAMYDDIAAAQFENVNALRSYPFAEGSSLVDRLGRELPRDVVVDLHFVVPPASGMPLPGVSMTSVHLSRSMVSACFASGGNALSVIVSRDDFRPYFPYRLEKLAGSSDAGGIVTFGDFGFPGEPETYFLDGAAVHPCCVAVASPPKLRSFFDPRSGDSVSGDAEIAFSGYVTASRSGSSFRLGLEDGASEELASECAKVSGAEACGATPISSINGVRPDADGNIVLWFH